MRAEKLRTFLFDMFMAALAAVFFGLSLTYSPKARFVPLVIAAPVLALALGRTGMAALALIREWKEIAADRPSLWRKEMVAAAWVVLLLALVWLLGFIPAIPLFMILALRLRAHEPWRLTLFLTLGVWLFMYGLFVWALNVQFEYGYLVNLFLS